MVDFFARGSASPYLHMASALSALSKTSDTEVPAAMVLVSGSGSVKPSPTADDGAGTFGRFSKGKKRGAKGG